MTSPPNLMEVISKGSIDMYARDHEQQHRHRPLSSSLSSHRETLQSLESLPPDEPSVMTSSSTFTATSDCSTETYSDSMTDSSGVYARIHQLADTVKREVTAMRSGATEPEGEEISSIKPAQGDKKGQGSVIIEERKKKGVEESDLEMAAKVKRALAKMRHLDSRLADLSKKEKDVKRQRLALEQQSDMQSDSRSSSTLLPVESMAVFPTQPLYHSSSACEVQCVESQDSMISVQTEEVECTSDSKKETVEDHTVSDDRFIKRNIQLASDAGSLIAMTEEEKKRLEQLLTDNDDEKMSENEEEGESHNMQLIPAAAGFTFSEDDMERLGDIDSQLQNIIPALQWPTTLSQNDLSSEQTESVSDGKLSPSTTTTTTTQAGPGEAVLLMLQTDREASNRLHQIETMLNHLQANKDQHDTNSDPSHNIDHELLQELLKQCRDEQNSSQSSLHAH